MKLPKSSENMLKAFSMGGSWAGRVWEAEEDEEEEEEEGGSESESEDSGAGTWETKSLESTEVRGRTLGHYLAR